MREAAGTMRSEFIGLYGMVERNWYLIKRYAWWEIAFFFWTAANTLTIVFIAKGVEATGGKVDIDQLTTILLIGAVMWSYLGIVFELLIETVAWERWEGTIEYTFMAPLTRATRSCARRSCSSRSPRSSACTCRTRTSPPLSC